MVFSPDILVQCLCQEITVLQSICTTTTCSLKTHWAVLLLPFLEKYILIHKAKVIVKFGDCPSEDPLFRVMLLLLLLLVWPEVGIADWRHGICP